MLYLVQKQKNSITSKIFSSFIAFTFIVSFILPPQYVQAQMASSVLNLPVPGAMVTPSAGYNPVLIKGLTLHPENALEFDFIVNAGDTGKSGNALESESKKLIKYFLASLTTPEDQMWVNLSPYENDRIINKDFGQTEMGRDLLAQDYILKQLASSLIYPEDPLGQDFWDRVYSKAMELYGTTDIPMNTFNKVWIVPEKATVFQNGESVFVIESHLKVMLEEDYVALKENMNNVSFGLNTVEGKDAEVISGITSDVVREVLIPEIEKEVNQGKNFANLRQIFHSAILAAWFKRNLKESLLGQVYVDKNKVRGVEHDDANVNEKIYHQYLEAFKKGVFNYIREDYDSEMNDVIPRKYFSGGTELSFAMLTTVLPEDGIPDAYIEMEDQMVADSSRWSIVKTGLTDVGERASSNAIAKIENLGGQATDDYDVKIASNDGAMSAKNEQKAMVIRDGFQELVDTANSDISESAKKFLEIFKNKIAYVPFYTKLSGLTEDQIVKEIIEDTYAPYLEQLKKIDDLIKSKKIFVDAAYDLVRVSLKDPIKVSTLPEGEVFDVIMWPMKGDPWQSGHVWMGFEAISKYNLDEFIPTIDDSDPTRKPGLHSLMIRNPETAIVFELYGKLAKRESFMQEIPELLTADGERVLFTFFKLNQHLPMHVRYGAGSDHANIYALIKREYTDDNFLVFFDEVFGRYEIIKSEEEFLKVKKQLEEKGFIDAEGNAIRSKLIELRNFMLKKGYLHYEEDKSGKKKLVIRKKDDQKKGIFKPYVLGENYTDLKIDDDLKEMGVDTELMHKFVYQLFFEPDVPTKIMFHMINNTEGFQNLEKMPQISILFNQRKNEEVDTTLLDKYEGYINERLKRKGIKIKPIELITTTQPLDISSSEIRDEGHHWKIPFSVAQLSHALQMWSFQTPEIEKEQKQLADDLFEEEVLPIIENSFFDPVARNQAFVNVVKGLKSLTGLGINQFDKYISGKVIGLNEGTWMSEIDEKTKKDLLEWFESIRGAAMHRAQELIDKGLENPFPIRRQDEPLLAELIQSGEMKLPNVVIRYLDGREKIFGNLNAKEIAQDLGLTKDLIDVVLSAYADMAMTNVALDQVVGFDQKVLDQLQRAALASKYQFHKTAGDLTDQTQPYVGTKNVTDVLSQVSDQTVVYLRIGQGIWKTFLGLVSQEKELAFPLLGNEAGRTTVVKANAWLAKKLPYNDKSIAYAIKDDNKKITGVIIDSDLTGDSAMIATSSPVKGYDVNTWLLLQNTSDQSRDVFLAEARRISQQKEPIVGEQDIKNLLNRQGGIIVYVRIGGSYYGKYMAAKLESVRDKTPVNVPMPTGDLGSPVVEIYNPEFIRELPVNEKSVAFIIPDESTGKIKGIILESGLSSEPVKKEEDKASLTLPALPASHPTYGGIDLDPKLLDLQIKRDAKGIPLPVFDQPIEDMHIQGFIPIIINIQPITELPMLIGYDASADESDDVSLNPDMLATEPEYQT